MKMLSFKEYLMEEKKGTYAAVQPSKSDGEQLHKMLVAHGVPNPETPEKLHATLLYSRKHLPLYNPDEELEHHADIHKLEVWPTKSGKNCLVMKLHSPALEKRHELLMKKHRATYDYPDFKPHVSLSYDIGDFDHKDLHKHLPKSIRLGREYKEPLDVTGK